MLLRCTRETYQSVRHQGVSVVRKHFERGEIWDWPDGVPYPEGYFEPAGGTPAVNSAGLTEAEVQEFRKWLTERQGKREEESETGAHRPGFATLQKKPKQELVDELGRLGLPLSGNEEHTKNQLINMVLDARERLEE
jgi:hypothetical protein